MFRRLKIVLACIAFWCLAPYASGQGQTGAITVVYWGSKDCRWCTYWESSASGLEAEFRASKFYPGINYLVVKNNWLRDPYVESDFPADQRWLWDQVQNGTFRAPSIRPTWSIFVGQMHLKSYIGTKAWNEAALAAVQRLTSARDESPAKFQEVLIELQPRKVNGEISVTDVDAVPYLDKAGRDAYTVWLGRPAPRAFALSLDGAWGRAKTADDALTYCRRYASEPCEVYAIDTTVVWHNPPNK